GSTADGSSNALAQGCVDFCEATAITEVNAEGEGASATGSSDAEASYCLGGERRGEMEVKVDFVDSGGFGLCTATSYAGADANGDGSTANATSTALTTE